MSNGLGLDQNIHPDLGPNSLQFSSVIGTFSGLERKRGSVKLKQKRYQIVQGCVKCTGQTHKVSACSFSNILYQEDTDFIPI